MSFLAIFARGTRKCSAGEACGVSGRSPTVRSIGACARSRKKNLQLEIQENVKDSKDALPAGRAGGDKTDAVGQRSFLLPSTQPLLGSALAACSTKRAALLQPTNLLLNLPQTLDLRHTRPIMDDQQLLPLLLFGVVARADERRHAALSSLICWSLPKEKKVSNSLVVRFASVVGGGGRSSEGEGFFAPDGPDYLI